MLVAIPGRRSIVRDTPDGLEVMIPARRNAFVLIFLSAWLVGWAFGELSAAREILSARSGGADLFLVVWLSMWTLGGAWAGYSWLWTAVGREIVSLRSGTLCIRRDTLGLGKTQEYELTHVKDLRVTAQPTDPMVWNTGMRSWGVLGGAIAFDYGAKTLRFGAVDEAEASQIVADLKSRHAFAGSDSR